MTLIYVQVHDAYTDLPLHNNRVMSTPITLMVFLLRFALKTTDRLGCDAFIASRSESGSDAGKEPPALTHLSVKRHVVDQTVKC